jgi:hypothetical protein
MRRSNKPALALTTAQGDQMNRHAIGATLALTTLFAASPVSVGAQGSQVVVQVFQSIVGVPTFPAVGAAVCLSSTENTKITDGSGRVIYENIPAGTWSVITWKSGFRTRRTDVTVPGTGVIPVVVTLRDRGTEASPCTLPPVARLGEQTLTRLGRTAVITDGERLRDCRQFGTSFVLVGLTGKMGEAIDELRLVCAPMLANGSVSAEIKFTNRWDTSDDAGTSFGRHCPAGRAVSGIAVTVHNLSGQIRSASIDCKTVGTTGLTTGTALTLAPIGIPTTSTLPATRCSDGRPARAMRLGADAFTPTLSNIFSPVIIATAQLICEQPVVP